jgi:phenylacetate-coenzyme A ligase PaaK-like adenylate-forming protein
MWTQVRRMRELQWRPADEIDARALERLRSLLAHAAAHVPYYRDLLGRAGTTSDDVRDLPDLSRLPVTAKADLRAAFPTRTVADNLPAARRRSMLTSGSTGLPFEFFWDRAAADALLGAHLFSLEWAGVGIWDPRVVIAVPSYFGTNAAPASRLRRLGRRLALGERSANLASDQLTPTIFRGAVRQVAGRGRYRYYVRGYPASIARLARRLLEEGAVAPGAPAAVMTYAETLTPADAASIRQAFGCEVVNYYSSWDVPQMAQTCPDNPRLLHVNSERVILRVVRPDGTTAGAGEPGRVVVTDLDNYVMPLINYAVGDRAIAGAPCPCGRGFPTLESVEGRDTEIIRTPSGRLINGGTLGHFLAFVVGVIPYIWEYQFVQATPAAVTLRIVPTPRLTPAFEKTLQDQVATLLGPGLAVDVEVVDHIPVEPSGKRVIVKSCLPPN